MCVWHRGLQSKFRGTNLKSFLQGEIPQALIGDQHENGKRKQSENNLKSAINSHTTHYKMIRLDCKATDMISS